MWLGRHVRRFMGLPGGDGGWRRPGGHPGFLFDAGVPIGRIGREDHLAAGGRTGGVHRMTRDRPLTADSNPQCRRAL